MGTSLVAITSLRPPTFNFICFAASGSWEWGIKFEEVNENGDFNLC